MAIDDFHTSLFMTGNGTVVLVCPGREGHTQHHIYLTGRVRGPDRRCAQEAVTNLGAAVIGNNMLKGLERARTAKVTSAL